MTVVLQGVVGCAEFVASLQPNWTELVISDAKSVAGKWERLLIRLPRSWRDDWVSITIAEDGSYVWANYRQVGYPLDSSDLKISRSIAWEAPIRPQGIAPTGVKWIPHWRLSWARPTIIYSGHLSTVGERGQATGTLYVAGDRRMLRVVGRSKDGLEDTAELELVK
jgi:hypothetical protein